MKQSVRQMCPFRFVRCLTHHWRHFRSAPDRLFPAAGLDPDYCRPFVRQSRCLPLYHQDLCYFRHRDCLGFQSMVCLFPDPLASRPLFQAPSDCLKYPECQQRWFLILHAVFPDQFSVLQGLLLGLYRLSCLDYLGYPHQMNYLGWLISEIFTCFN